MQRTAFTLSAFLLLTSGSSLRAQASLPLATEVSFERLQAHVQRLRQALRTLRAPLPAETDRALDGILKDGSGDPNESAQRIQKLLDPLCLVGVNINPESRVKVARGPARAELRHREGAIVLVKVHNEAGVTQALKVSGPQMRSPQQQGPECWLEATVLESREPGKGLSGDRLEYVLLRLTAHESGKREATLKFDVGQGTQDLGFRAEVPVLFAVQPRDR